MKTRLIASLALAITVCASLYALKKPRHPTREAISDTWVGYTEDDLMLFRLTLHQSGTGSCAYTYTNDPARLYSVRNWTLSGYTLVVDLDPIDKEAEPIWMKGKTTGWHLNLQIGGKRVKWKRELKLYRESEFLHKRDRLMIRMNQKA